MNHIHLPKRLLSGALAAALALSPAAAAFTDTEGHWAKDSISKWSEEYGIINGYEDGTFRPDSSITRGAFAGILDRFLKFRAISPAETFSDTAGTYWEESILKLHASGVYLGNNGKALVGDSITRQQAVTMIARAFQIDPETVTLPYQDADQFAEYAKGPVAEMTLRGYITDCPDGNFRPQDPVTRAEIVNILNNMIAVLVKEPADYTLDVPGTMMINAADGASLTNITISGDLILAPGITGPVTLTNVNVEGMIRNFSEIQPTFLSAPGVSVLPGSPEETDPSQPGIIVTPLEPDTGENPGGTSPGITPITPGIQPGEVYTPGATTGETIEYDGRKIPVYAGRDRAYFQNGDFVWNEDGTRLLYTGNQFRTRFGIDVSAYQNRASDNETIDWNAVAADGVEFAMVRIGLRGYSNGAVREDAFYRQNIQGAMAAGIQTGVYFFAQAITVEEAIEEADFVIEHLRDLQINGPVAYDWELNSSSYRVNNTTPEMATACAVAFCQRVQAAGYTPMVYAGQKVSYLKYDQGALAPYLYWYPEYKSASSESLFPTYGYQMDIWQFTSSCQIDGIGGKVDANIQFIR